VRKSLQKGGAKRALELIAESEQEL